MSPESLTTQNGRPYVTMYGYESHGSYGMFAIRIQVASSKPLPDLGPMPNDKPNPIWRAAHDAADKVEAEVRAAQIAADPESAVRAAEERAELIDLFPAPIYVEEVRNGYDPSWHNRHLPWFVVTTKVGRITIGWRRRVISIDWTDTRGTKTSAELFAAEDVTKGERSIHAWSMEKARAYVAAIMEGAS